jgi:hypothetical protein
VFEIIIRDAMDVVVQDGEVLLLFWTCGLIALWWN